MYEPTKLSTDNEKNYNQVEDEVLHPDEGEGEDEKC